jgi:hypothetical protein
MREAMEHPRGDRSLQQIELEMEKRYADALRHAVAGNGDCEEAERVLRQVSEYREALGLGASAWLDRRTWRL